MNEYSCRICLQDANRKCFTLKTSVDEFGLSYTEIYEDLCTRPSCGPQVICEECSEVLLSAYRFKKQLESNEKLFIDINLIKIDVKTNFVGIKCEENREIESVEGTTNNSEIVQDDVGNDCDDNFTEPDEEDAKDTFKIKCPLCSEQLNGKNSYKTHVKEIHKNRKLECDGCDEKFHYVYTLLEHRELQHNFKHEYSFANACKYCDNSFTSKRRLRHHIVTVHPYRHKCPDCDAKYHYSLQLSKHRRITHNYVPDNETMVCRICAKLIQRRNLETHVKNMHNKEFDHFICDLCGAKYKTKSVLKTHMKSKHMTKQQLNCRYCPETFKNYCTRRTHETRFHTHQYNFPCTFCPKKFMEGVQLKRHIATHTGERQYRCETCGLAFITLTNLKSHQASHSDIRPFACTICNATFKTRLALGKHGRVHKERNYECPVCLQKYLVNQQLRNHIIKNHPEYDLPPPGTVMNKSALNRIQAVSQKYNVEVSASVGMSGRKISI